MLGRTIAGGGCQAPARTVDQFGLSKIHAHSRHTAARSRISATVSLRQRMGSSGRERRRIRVAPGPFTTNSRRHREPRDCWFRSGDYRWRLKWLPLHGGCITRVPATRCWPRTGSAHYGRQPSHHMGSSCGSGRGGGVLYQAWIPDVFHCHGAFARSVSIGEQLRLLGDIDPGMVAFDMFEMFASAG